MPIDSTLSPPPSSTVKGGVTLKKGSGAPLAESAMLVTLKITGWTARKKDKNVTSEVAEAHKVSEDAGAYWKQLLNKSAVNKVRAASQSARDVHYKNTLPWEDEGARILPSRNFASYREELRAAYAVWEAARDEFLNQYPTLVEQAQAELNGLFNPAEYPKAHEIAAKFGWKQRTNPVPSAEDFRVDVADGEKERIKGEIRDQHEAWVRNSSTSLWERLYEVVNRFAKAMGNKDQKVYRASLVNSMLELCNLLPALNVSDDPALEQMRQKVESSLCKRDVGDYKGEEGEGAREEAAKEASSILDAMSIYTG